MDPPSHFHSYLNCFECFTLQPPSLSQRILISHEILHLPGVHDREEVVGVLRCEVQDQSVKGLEGWCLFCRTDHGHILDKLLPGYHRLQHSMGLWAWNEEIKHVLQIAVPFWQRVPGCWSNFRGNYLLMSLELLTFKCREMIKLSIHIYS